MGIKVISGTTGISRMAAAAQNPYGVSDSAWGKVPQNDKPILLSMPQNVVAVYKMLAPDDKKGIEDGLEGSIPLFGSKRQIFIDGHVGPFSFSWLVDQFANIPDPEAKQRIVNALNQLQPLQPQQRSALLDLLDADTGRTSTES